MAGFNDDHSLLAIMHASEMEWTASPSATVWRKRFELSGDPEKGRVTSLVRYDPNSRFPEHRHPEGEELFVVSGTFSDEHGRYPAGTYVLNPAGTAHAPFSDDGCVLFVKLRQYVGDDRPQLVIDTRAAAWQPHAAAGVELLPLYQSDAYPEIMRLVRLSPGAQVPAQQFPAGEEIFVLDGAFEDEHGSYQTGSWVRYPPGSGHTPRSSGGCLLYVKKGHLTR